MCCDCRFLPYLLIFMLCTVIHYSLCENLHFSLWIAQKRQQSCSSMDTTPPTRCSLSLMLKPVRLLLEWSSLFTPQRPLRTSGCVPAISRKVREYLPSIVPSTFRNSCSSMNSPPSCNQCKWFYFASEEILSSRSLLQLCRACWHMQSINSP